MPSLLWFALLAFMLAYIRTSNRGSSGREKNLPRVRAAM